MKYTVEVNMSKGWEIVLETTNGTEAFTRLVREMNESSTHPDAKEDVRLTVEF